VQFGGVERKVEWETDGMGNSGIGNNGMGNMVDW